MTAFSVVWIHADVFINGLLITISIGGLGIIFGTLVGTGIAVFRSHVPRIERVVRWYVDFFRAAPIVVLLIWFFYAFPLLTGFGMEAFWTAVLVLTLWLSAAMAETLRTGIEGVPAGQKEAGRALGLSEFQITRRVVLPQAFRSMLPLIAGLYAEQLKNTALASIITVNELLHVSQILISQTYRTLEIYTTVAVLFIAMILPLVYATRRLESSRLSMRRPV